MAAAMMSDKRLLRALPKTIDKFARRRVRGSYGGERTASYIRLCADRTTAVETALLLETETLIEVMVRIEAPSWTAAFVAKKAKLNGSSMWSATPTEILSVGGVTLSNVEEVVGWLNLP